MKIKAKTSIDVRFGEPKLTAPTYHRLGAESEIEVDGKLYPGDKIGNIATWYKDVANRYYWSGGMEVVKNKSSTKATSLSSKNIQSFLEEAPFPPELINWNRRIAKLPDSIKNNLGDGIKVALLDTGVGKLHVDLSRNIICYNDFTNSTAIDNDIIGHGTSMASFIVANAFFRDKGIIGIAPSAKLISEKVMYDENDPQDFLSVGKGIEDASIQNAHIINMSIGRNDISPEVARTISQISNVTMVASTKQWQDNLPFQLLQFPANCQEVIPVACLPKDYVTNSWDQLPAPLIIFPFTKCWCCTIKDNNFYLQESGSSVSAAMLSGIIALILAGKSSIGRNKAQILTELANYSSSIDEAYNNPESEIHFIYKQSQAQ
jgi:subtilisin family serine protease